MQIIGKVVQVEKLGRDVWHLTVCNLENRGRMLHLLCDNSGLFPRSEIETGRMFTFEVETMERSIRVEESRLRRELSIEIMIDVLYLISVSYEDGQTTCAAQPQ